MRTPAVMRTPLCFHLRHLRFALRIWHACRSGKGILEGVSYYAARQRESSFVRPQRQTHRWSPRCTKLQCTFRLHVCLCVNMCVRLRDSGIYYVCSSTTTNDGNYDRLDLCGEQYGHWKVTEAWSRLLRLENKNKYPRQHHPSNLSHCKRV